MNTKSEIGKSGEEMAADFLINKKYKIIEINYRQVFGEIDIVAKSPNRTLVFVEVKTLIAGGGGIAPEDNMTSAKIKKFKRIAQFYAAKNPKLIDEEKGWRMDVVAIDMPDNSNAYDFRAPQIRHYENIA